VNQPYNQQYQQGQRQQGQYPPAYPQQGYGGYQAPYAPPTMPRPANHLVWAIVTVFLFWPTAIFAIIKANQVDRLWSEGQYARSTEASGTAKTLCLVGTIIGVIVIALFVVLWVFLIAAGTFVSTIPH
jgi:hypothetical protein